MPHGQKREEGGGSRVYLECPKVRYFRNPCDRDPPTRNFKNSKFFKKSLKILNVLGNERLLLGERASTFGERASTFGE